MPKSRVEFWQKKFEANIKRDDVVRMELQDKGINGTGKTTIAKAIEFSEEPQKIEELQSFFTENPASV